MPVPVRPSTPRQSAEPSWRPRTELALVLDQIEGLEGWRRDRDPARADHPPAPAAPSREQHLDRTRRREASLRERSALLRSLDRQLAGTRVAGSGPRAVVAHRHAWFRDRLAAALEQRGVDVVALADDGAEALGIAVAEQPDLLLVQELLPSLTGLEVLTAASTHAHHTLLAVQLAHAEHEPAHVAGGARVVLSDSVPPAEVAQRLLVALTGRATADLPGPDPAGRRRPGAARAPTGTGGATASTSALLRARPSASTR